MNTSKQVQEAVGGYFKDPTGTSKLVGSNMQGSGETFTLTRDDMPKLKEELQKSVRRVADFEKLKDHIEMTVTAEGLRIELMEGEDVFRERESGTDGGRQSIPDRAGQGVGEAFEQGVD